MSNELKKKIEGMMKFAELNYDDWASVKEDEIVGLRKALSEIQTPLDILNHKRYMHVGDLLFSGARDSLTNNGVPRRTLPVMKLDNQKLHKFLSLLRSMGLLRRALLSDSMIYNDSAKTEYVNTIFEDGEICDMQLDHLSGVMQQWTEEAISDVGLHISSNLRNQLIHSTDQDMGQVVCNGIRDAWDNRQMTPVYNSLVSSLFTWSRDPEDRSASQKGKGIQLLSETPSGHDMFHTASSMFMTLETAKNATTAELLATLDMVPVHNLSTGQSCLRDMLRHNGSSLYIRTCPASPRPGVLPNIKAESVKEFVDGVRYLANAMSDPDHPDYDPEGELCVMKYMESDMSGVLVKGHGSMVVGLGTSGVTAGEGSTLVIPMSDVLSDKLTHQFNLMMNAAPDGFDNHEIEMVWPRDDVEGNYGHGMDVTEVITEAGYMESNRKPVITQIRGLGKAKPALKPPSTYVDQETGESVTMTIRGNVPHGVVSQVHYEDVGKGDLSDCAKLEADLKSGLIVEGQKDFVIYCPSGSTNCHAAGVANDHDLAIIYAPVHEDVTWTEVGGWVTTATGVEPSPYDATPFTPYFFDGCRDGDRYWDYGYHSLSQFFHTYISSPYNDPRFEAYLAGFYSTWIIKATLAVGLGESRHGYHSQAKFTMKAGLMPLLLLKASNRLPMFKHGMQGRRTDFYEVFKNREIGLDGMLTALKGVRECFTRNISWASSYGGNNYCKSIEKAIKSVEALIDLKNGGKLSKVLGTINTLENAVHNCSYFFDKFVSSKAYFDIGTSNHLSLSTIPQQYMTVVPLHTHFYTNIVDEPQKVSDDGHGNYELRTLQPFNLHIMQSMNKLIDLPIDSNGIEILNGDYGSRVLKHVESIMDYLSHHDENHHLHKVGQCLLPNCAKHECVENRWKSENDIEIDAKVIHNMQHIIGSRDIGLTYDDDPYAYFKHKLTPRGKPDPTGTVFTSSHRLSEQSNKPCYEELIDANLKMIADIEVPVLKIVSEYTSGGTTYREGDWVLHPDALVAALYGKWVKAIPFENVTMLDVEHIFRFIMKGDFPEHDHPSMFLNSVIESLAAEAKNCYNHMLVYYSHLVEGTLSVAPLREPISTARYMLTLWLSEYIVRKDGWDVGVYGSNPDISLPDNSIWRTGVKSEYHSKHSSYPNTVFFGHTTNQLLQVLMSIIDIDTLKQILEEEK